MRFVGISGEAGSGKDAVAAILSRAMRSAAVISLGDLIRGQLSAIGVDPDRTLQRTAADYWRKTVSSGYWVDLAISQAGTEVDTLVLTGIYAPGEARYLQQLGGLLVWVEASEGLRLQRIENRADGARDELLVRDAAAFTLQLEAERGQQLLGDGATASLLQVKDVAQYFIRNDGDLDDLNAAIGKLVIHLNREFSHPTGNLSLITISEEMGYDAASPWAERT
jgi:cytidylate kinase